MTLRLVKGSRALRVSPAQLHAFAKDRRADEALKQLELSDKDKRTVDVIACASGIGLLALLVWAVW